MLFRQENLENLRTAVRANGLPWTGRALYGLNQLLGTRLCRAGFGRALRRAYRGRVPHWDLTIPLSKVHDDVVVSSLFFGTYESAEVFLARELLYPAGDVVELGASMGVLSAHIARRLAPGARLVCVEPNVQLHAAIAQTVAENSPGARCTVVGAAVHYGSAETVTLDVSNVNSARVSEAGGMEGLTVPVTSLSQVLREHGIGPYTLVCDIEGAEAGLLTCDAKALEGCQNMLIETHETDFQGQRFGTSGYLERLFALGFRAKRTIHRSSTLAVHFLSHENRESVVR
jgi:FkbM family methyltransferase